MRTQRLQRNRARLQVAFSLFIIGAAFMTASASDADVTCDDRDITGCGVQGPADCRNNDFPDLSDAVEVHLDNLGMQIDGDLSDGIANGAVTLVDLVNDLAGTNPGITGDQEQPRVAGDPNGFNIAEAVLLFMPDSNVTDGVDNSFLYVAWDVSDFIGEDGLPPRPFDSDDNDCAWLPGLPDVFDTDAESYRTELQACTRSAIFTNPDVYDAVMISRNPESIASDQDAAVACLIDELFFGLTCLTGPPTLDVVCFPTGDPVFNPRNECIDEEIDTCGAGRDVECVIKAVETSGTFGPHPSPAPDSDQARDNRIALAQLLARLRAASEGDGADEEFANVVLRTSIPDLEVTKLVRCADTGEEFSREVDALPGSEVEFEITITNFGNEDLAVTVTDVMQAVGTQSGFVSFDPICVPLTGTLTSPRRGLVDEPVNAGNALSLGLEDTFFFDTDPGVLCSGFINAVENSESELLGTLLGAEARRENEACVVLGGDELVIRFKATVGVTDEELFCEVHSDADVENGVTVTGTLPGETAILATDEYDSVDTDRERAVGADDNVAVVDLLCSDGSCTKLVCADLNNDGDCDDSVDLGFSGDLELPCNVEFPFILAYKIEFTNTQETDLENVELCDLDLVNDVTAAGLAFVSCELDPADGCKDCGTVGPGESCTAMCEIRVPDRDAWDVFAGSDDEDPADPDCYANSATASGTASTTGVCSPTGSISVETSCEAAVCIGKTCDISVTKGFRCVNNCDERTPIGSLLDELPALPGATVEFEIAVTSEQAADDDPICALRFTDTLTGDFEPCPEPFCRVQVINGAGDPTCSVPPDWFKTDGTEFELNLWQACGVLLTSGDRVVIRCAGTVANDASGTIENQVAVICASDDGANCLVDPPIFCGAPEEADASVDVQVCDFSVDKDVTCDDPRDPGAVFAGDVDALPGSTVGFRIQVCNTGEVDLPRLNLNDVLGCPSWYVPLSVEATINGDNVTDCICPAGGCAEFDDLNGDKDLEPCRAGGIRATNPDECLTIIFEVSMPADFDTIGADPDCLNTVTVTAFTDVCGPENACGQEGPASTEIDVLVPEIECVKAVCADVDNDGDCDDPDDFDYAENLALPCDMPFPFTLIHRARVTNTGETALVDVEACDPPYGCQPCAPRLEPGESCDVTWPIPVPDRDAWVALAGSDHCYDNTATASGDVDTATICERGADTDVDSSCSAEVCLPPPCEISVTKGVRCVDDCVNRNPVGDLVDSLGAMPGAAIEFEIRIRNEDPDVPICALRLNDILTGPFEPCAPPPIMPPFCRVQLVNGAGDPLCTLPPDWFQTDGATFELDVFGACGALMNEGDEIVIRCAGTVPPGATGVITNDVDVTCAPDDGENCADGPIFCGNAVNASAEVQIETCDFTVAKQARCEGEGEDAWRDSAEALPGANVEFRIQVCNTGEVDLPRLSINDVLDCPSWYVPSSLVATIDGVDVTDCICPAGNCAAIGDMNGPKDLAACRPGGISATDPDECLTITFAVTVDSGAGPAVECTNAVNVDVANDMCGPASACGGPKAGSAKIIVQVPDLGCEKGVCLGIGCTGFQTRLVVEFDNVDFPLVLRYRFRILNPGEVDLEDAEICDPQLLSLPGVSCVPIAPVGGCLPLGGIPAQSASVDVICDVPIVTEGDFEDLVNGPCSDGGESGCYMNTAEASAMPDVGDNICGEPQLLDGERCQSEVCICVEPCLRPPCPPVTKAHFDVWNANEDGFSGTTRCMSSWDQTLLSDYTDGSANHFWRTVLHTDKGKARINGVASTVCEESIDVPLLGVAAKILHFNNQRMAMAAMTLVGQGHEAGQIKYDLVDPPDPLQQGVEKDARPMARSPVGSFLGPAVAGPEPRDADRGGTDTSVAALNEDGTALSRAAIDQKGSLLVWANVEIKWDRDGNLIQDTFISLANDYPEDVHVQIYIVDDDFCIWVDNLITLTGNEPTYWSVASGEPKGVSPFTLFGSCPDDDPFNPGGRRLRGYVLAWAVEPITRQEIRWNHLSGAAQIVNYRETFAWEYNAWAFQAVAGTVNGDLLLDPLGQLDLDGIEYDVLPAMLLLDFYASGAMLPPAPGVSLDTDLTLWAGIKDLRAPD